MTAQTCEKHGTNAHRSADGTMICTYCGQPAFGRSSPTTGRGMRSSGSTSVDDRILAALTAIQRSTEEQNERLRKIWWALFGIWAPIFLLWVSLRFGWFEIEVVIGPAAE